jgi:hypothetical protein
MPLYVGWHPQTLYPGSTDRDYLGTSHETTWPRFTLGGHLPLSDPM